MSGELLGRANDRPAVSPPSPLMLPALLLAYVAAMLVFGLCVRDWAPLHADTTEMVAWGASPALGYSKHPPLGAWLAGLWFAVMPHTNWSCNLLSVLVAAGGLAGIWKLAGLVGDSGAQRLAMLPLMLTPAFTTWAFKYNANSILLLVWPWAAYHFVRLLETRALWSGVWTGVFCALSILGKYYSVVLIATFLLMLLLHPARGAVVRAPALYAAAAAALVVLAPHVWWLYDTGGTPIMYAVEKAQRDVWEARSTTVRSVVASLLTLILPAIVLLLALRDEPAPLKGRLRAGLADRNRRWVLALAAGPTVFTILAHLVTNVRIGGDFLLPAFVGVPLAVVLLLGGPVRELSAFRMTLGVAIVLGGVTLLSPLIGIATFLTARHPYLEPRMELAAAATDFWRGAMGTPLPQVAGAERLATGIHFYSADHPTYVDGSRAFAFDYTNPDITRRGLLFVCAQEDGACLAGAQRVLGLDTDAQERGIRRFTWTGSHAVLGHSGPMLTVELFLLPPS